jgi:hypothetical protein
MISTTTNVSNNRENSSGDNNHDGRIDVNKSMVELELG